MNNWLKRHIALTREEQLLITGILVILLCGLGVQQCHRSAGSELISTQSQETDR